ncbi:LysR family transcriptional regulator [Nocardioides bizhenqiangii]|uniref:LysR substrate-binding domain-containing protein n=1 Tax=Nocardioides bizhenqiangii TaxID=3095076 RepID=A0ABZ0ZQ41_9ACTN|nr:LysR substrate-binding domain-containing protein [Nocardioides sp. HM61]WQQ26343.1 LysR substrate-binding domain-containing protein [Nocardioides sp. HM61]
MLAEVADRGSFSAAAAALGMTQSAVSQHISALERAVGASVVDRASRPVQLTEAGVILVRHARAVVARLDVAEQELAVAAGRRGGRLRLGAFPTALATFLPPVLARFQRKHPTVRLTVVDDHVPRLQKRLVDGELDLAVTYDHDAMPDLAPPDLQRVHLFDDPFRAVLPRGHRLTKGAGLLGLVDLADETWVGGSAQSAWFRILRHACREAGFEPRVALTSDDYIGVQAFVAANLGVAVVPGLATAPAGLRVTVRELRAPVPVRRIWVARENDAYPSPAVQAMVDTLTSLPPGAGRPRLRSGAAG